MNERIKELAEQADKWTGNEFHRLFLNNINANMKEMFEKKLAELIVRECMIVLVESREVRQTAYYYRNKIAEHFGVE